MAQIAGAHSERVSAVRDLRTAKGRKEQRRFAFEGPTLFAEAVRSGAQILEIYATRTVHESESLVREIEASGTPVYIVDDRTAEIHIPNSHEGGCSEIQVPDLSYRSTMFVVAVV